MIVIEKRKKNGGILSRNDEENRKRNKDTSTKTGANERREGFTVLMLGRYERANQAYTHPYGQKGGFSSEK